MNFCKRLEQEQSELLVAERTYNSCCLIGNWPGEVLLQEVNKLPLCIKCFIYPFFFSSISFSFLLDSYFIVIEMKK